MYVVFVVVIVVVVAVVVVVVVVVAVVVVVVLVLVVVVVVIVVEVVVVVAVVVVCHLGEVLLHSVDCLQNLRHHHLKATKNQTINGNQEMRVRSSPVVATCSSSVPDASALLAANNPSSVFVSKISSSDMEESSSSGAMHFSRSTAVAVEWWCRVG